MFTKQSEIEVFNIFFCNKMLYGFTFLCKFIEAYKKAILSELCRIFLKMKSPLWPRVNIVASHLADPVRFLVWSVLPVEVFPGVFRRFSSTVRQMSGKYRPHPTPDIIGHNNLKTSFITGASDLWCWRILKRLTCSSPAECSAQEQVLHCKRRNLGCSSAEGKSSTTKPKLQF